MPADIDFLAVMVKMEAILKPSYARSRCHTQLAKMSFDEILDLPAAQNLLIVPGI